MTAREEVHHLNAIPVPKKKNVTLKQRFCLMLCDGRCFYCNRILGARSVSVDHLIPKSRGGFDNRANVVAACKPCNGAKGNRNPSADEIKKHASLLMALKSNNSPWKEEATEIQFSTNG